MKLAADRLSLTFGKEAALSEVSLTVDPGERVLVTGPSLSGKTVLLKCLAGLAAPSAGEIRWDGQPLGTLSKAEKRAQQARFGMVFQTDALFDSKTTLQNVALPLQNRGVPFDEALTRAKEALRRVGLEKAHDKRPEHLSGGMRKRAGIARAIVAQPEVLIADDPLAGLDPRKASEVCGLLAEVSEGRTLLFCAPDPPPEFPFPRWLLLERGRLVHDGAPRAFAEASSP